MKILKSILYTVLLITLFLTSCKDDATDQSNLPSPEEFQSLRLTALDNITQNFQFDPQNSLTSLISNRGVQVYIYSCNDASGNQVTGMIDLEFAEIFDRGTMLVTNKPTMGTSPSGEKGMLISGGEFYINATQNGEQLGPCVITVGIPVDLTGGMDYDMTLWEGNMDANNNFGWVQATSGFIDFGLLGAPMNYTAFITGNSGWFNCDIFRDDPRPKTDITVETPEGYDYENSAVYFLIL